LGLANSVIKTVRSFVASKPWLYPLLQRINNVRCRMWDLRHGVDTCGQIFLTSLDFQSPNKHDALRYESHHPLLTRSALMVPNISHENYAFIDFGCGKGRVLLIASEFPYGKIIGLEFAPQLAEMARRNVRSYRSRTQRCGNISVICMDATDFQLPPEPEVLYFYNPFSEQLMRRVAHEIEQSLQRMPRDLWIILTGPTPSRDRTFGALRQFERLRREIYFDIYRYRPRQ
jgi:SAM-dependent methyltransferase